MLRYLILILIIPAVLIRVQAQSDTLRFEQPGEGGDPVEYELIVLDPGYESFLATQPGLHYHSQSYYENWNQRYVIEWNIRHMQPQQYGDLCEVYIDYRPEINYGLELNYRLFYYFKFFEKENGVKLLPGKGR